MMVSISHRLRASLAGIFMIAAYAMLTYSITKNTTLGVITDIISGLAVIGIALLMFPLFHANHKKLNALYMTSKFIEGILMIIGGLLILSPTLGHYRETIYKDIHVYFFITGALLFYILLYLTHIVPKFISVWGIVATLLLFLITMTPLLGLHFPGLDFLVLPLILNEVFLSLWLIIKGFNLKLAEE